MLRMSALTDIIMVPAIVFQYVYTHSIAKKCILLYFFFFESTGTEYSAVNCIVIGKYCFFCAYIHVEKTHTKHLV